MGLPGKHTYLVHDPDLTRGVLSVEEASYRLGIGRAKGYQMAQAGTLPGIFRIGQSWRVNRAKLEKWLDSQG